MILYTIYICQSYLPQVSKVFRYYRKQTTLFLMQKLEDIASQVDFDVDCSILLSQIEEYIESSKNVPFEDNTFRSVLRQENLKQIVEYTQQQDYGKYKYNMILTSSLENFLINDISDYKSRMIWVQNKHLRASTQIPVNTLLLLERSYIINNNKYISGFLKIQNKRIENNQLIRYLQYKQLETIDDCMSLSGTNSILRTYGISAVTQHNLNYAVNFKQNLKYVYFYFNKKFLQFTLSIQSANAIFFAIGRCIIMVAIKDIQPGEQIVCFMCEQGSCDVTKLLEYNQKVYGLEITELQKDDQIISFINKVAMISTEENLEAFIVELLKQQATLLPIINLTATILQQLNKNITKVSDNIVKSIESYLSQDDVRKYIIYDISSIKQYVLLAYQLKQDQIIKILKGDDVFINIYEPFYGSFISLDLFLEQINMKDAYKQKQEENANTNLQQTITDVKKTQMNQIKNKATFENQSKQLLDNYYKTKELMMQNEKELQAFE